VSLTQERVSRAWPLLIALSFARSASTIVDVVGTRGARNHETTCKQSMKNIVRSVDLHSELVSHFSISLCAQCAGTR